MDLGLDYFRVLLALGLFQVEVLHTKIGMQWPVGVIGVSRQALSGFYKSILLLLVSSRVLPGKVPWQGGTSGVPEPGVRS
jgi:hypothetical protein